MEDIHAQLNESDIAIVPQRPTRPTKMVSIKDTFGVDFGFKMKHGAVVKDANGVPVPKDNVTLAFEQPGKFTPKVNPYHRFPITELNQFLMALQFKDTTYLVGHSGTGKTQLVNQVAARLNYNVITVSFDGHMMRSDLIGDWRLIGGQTVFRYGLIPLAFTEPGTIILLDEVDACPPETAFVLQRAVSEERKFLMPETNQQFELHEQNIVVATANTNGMGDDSSLYVAGTNIQNFSFLNRFKTTIQIDYITAAEEEMVLSQMFPQEHVKPFINGVVRVLANTRDAFKGGTLSVPLTTRDGINWLEKISRVPKPMKAARYSFLDRMPPNDAMSVAQIIQRIINCPEGDDKKYLGRGK